MWIAASLGGLSSPACLADHMDVTDVLTDTKLYFTAPLRWDAGDWLYFGGALAAIGAAHQFDDRVRSHFAVGERAVLNGSDTNDLRDAVPTALLVLGTWSFAQITDNSAGRVEAYTMLESATFSSITALTIRYAAGRERPDQTVRVDDWRAGGNSFPSLHSTAAFAVGTVFAESGGDDYRWIRRILGYGVAVGTAYIRVRDNDHWLSDAVAGAAIGVATARFTLNRRENRARQWDLSVTPTTHGGLGLSFTYNLQ